MSERTGRSSTRGLALWGRKADGPWAKGLQGWALGMPGCTPALPFCLRSLARSSLFPLLLWPAGWPLALALALPCPLLSSPVLAWPGLHHPPAGWVGGGSEADRRACVGRDAS
ncbi:uncharacterized protein K452DRAFT_11617 [Aplosporella prunicola CBS 121167]|uniref:Uncharacterized protein n=1 Tax=Aplosporella prunicola CBS 121167 TaxID=1176127 RepID=A0A6A6BF94_9PEZI|nr:uncharacterized protein K452DRAFT_11617 [Aplosporella prunicola CBS 121167]KAF2142840.1 hypothetical protein K452DRAFT_11617 [Aplosporella prunicola CBS 121167]